VQPSFVAIRIGTDSTPPAGIASTALKIRFVSASRISCCALAGELAHARHRSGNIVHGALNGGQIAVCPFAEIGFSLHPDASDLPTIMQWTFDPPI